MTDDDHKSPDAFLQKMDAGELDGNLGAEIKKLSHDHLEQIARMLMERDARERQQNLIYATAGPKETERPA
jgi:hypothetical protein